MRATLARQPSDLERLVADTAPVAAVAARLRGRRVVAVGTGTGFHAAQQAAHLLRLAGVDALALQSADAAHDVALPLGTGVPSASPTPARARSTPTASCAARARRASTSSRSAASASRAPTWRPSSSSARPPTPPATPARCCAPPSWPRPSAPTSATWPPCPRPSPTRSPPTRRPLPRPRGCCSSSAAATTRGPRPRAR